MSEQYFQGIRVGDKIWTIQEGWTEVTDIDIDNIYKIETTNESYTRDGKYIEDDAHQSAFWSDPQIVAPPRPKRYKKVKVEVRPYRTRQTASGFALLQNPQPNPNDTPSTYCGPSQTVTIEVEE